MPTVRIALAQVNHVVGDVTANEASVRRMAEEAARLGAQLVVYPELSITGYPPEDLVFKPSFIAANLAALRRLAASSGPMPLIVGFVDWEADRRFDAAAVLQNGSIVTVYRKILLPNYGVFDEKRYFEPGGGGTVLDCGDVAIGLTICEDIWHAEGPHRDEAASGANLIVNLSASPYHRAKWRQRQELVCTRAREAHAAIAYANMVGGQDDLVFDGFSLVVDHTGTVLAQAEGFSETLLVVDVPVAPRRATTAPHGSGIVPLALPPRPSSPLPAPALHHPSCEEEEIYQALVLATADYVRKNGFTDVVLGLSGGIDSALVASVAVDALGPAHVHALFMPSAFTSSHSREDAQAVARNLGISLTTIPIDPAVEVYRRLLAPTFAGLKEDITEENIQARIRGNLLMAFSNKFGYLVLTTGNKSEMACGYATLYGDMAGGFAVIKDVLKTMVFRLVAYRNARARGPWLPERLLTKAPSAELRPNQKDTDSLPPYEVLDPILEAYVEEDLPVDEIVLRGFERELVRRVARLVDRAEYKRRQAPPGAKITSKAFGRDRRLPITNRFRDEGT